MIYIGYTVQQALSRSYLFVLGLCQFPVTLLACAYVIPVRGLVIVCADGFHDFLHERHIILLSLCPVAARRGVAYIRALLEHGSAYD